MYESPAWCWYNSESKIKEVVFNNRDRIKEMGGGLMGQKQNFNKIWEFNCEIRKDTTLAGVVKNLLEKFTVY